MSEFFIRRPIFAFVLSIIIVILGAISLSGLPVEQYPDITPPNIQVSAYYQGADAMAVDEAVATPIGDAIVGVEDMLYMQSTSASDGTMTINVTFAVGSDPDMDAVFTQNNVATATALLPTSVTEQGVTTTKSNSDFLMVYALYSDGRYDDLFLSNYASINLQNELLKINGVGNVQVLGSGVYAMRIWVNPELLKYYSVTLSEIVDAVEAQSGVHSSGKLGAEPNSSKTEFTYTVTLPEPISRAEEYGDIIIKTLSDGSSLLLKDIARLELGSEDYGGISKFNANPAAIIAVSQAPGSNAMSVGSAVDAKMEELSARFYDGIGYEAVINASQPIEKGIRDIIFTLALALGLVILIVFIFLQELRAMLIPLVAIPVSLIGAFMLFPLLGLSVNVFSLLGLILAIGLVVDDAIVVVEAVQVNIAKGLTPMLATREAMRAVSSPIIATSVSLAAVFVPVSFIAGITGELYKQFAVTIALSVLISAFNALTLSPALCSIILRSGEEKKSGLFGAFNRWFSRRRDGYLSFTQTFTRHSARALLFIAIFGAGLFFSMRALPTGFLPQEDDGYFMIAVQLPDAASVERTEEVLEEIRDVVRRSDAVSSVASLAGFNMLSQVESTNSGILFVQLVDYSKRKMSAGELVDKFNGEIYFAVQGGEAFAFQAPAIPGLGTASGLSLVVQDRGGNPTSYIAKNAKRFIAQAKKLPQISSLTTQFSDDVPQRMVLIDRNRAMQEGVDLTELNTLLSTFLGGTYINNFNRFGQIYECYIQSEAEYRQEKSNINRFYIQNSSGESVPLGAFVEVVDTTGVAYIEQFNLYRSVSINANTAKGYSNSEAMAALEGLSDTILPKDMSIAWSGMSYEERNGSSGGMGAFVIAFLFVYLILAALYESWSLPLAVVTGVPIAASGAAALLWLAHHFIPSFDNNIFMQISLILLIGLSAKNAILVVEYANTLFFEQGRGVAESVMEAAKLRFRPILMTALAFVLGVLPLVFAGGPTKVAQNTLGVALVGGMTVATIFGIFIYPALYMLVAKVGNFEAVRQRREAKDKELRDEKLV
ncbi:MAG: efflux RND transporter permease subunit [Rikenellaceae bacterium]